MSLTGTTGYSFECHFFLIVHSLELNIRLRWFSSVTISRLGDLYHKYGVFIVYKHVREPQSSLLINQFPNEWQRFVNSENDGRAAVTCTIHFIGKYELGLP